MASAYELRFDYAKLDDARKKNLTAILEILLLDGGCQIEVSPVDFPDKFQFGIYAGFNSCGFVLVWDDEKSGFYFLKKNFETLLLCVVSERCMKMLSKLLVR
ncbi:hypothetical protein ES705_34776 [subsurface metagenome]